MRVEPRWCRLGPVLCLIGLPLVGGEARAQTTEFRPCELETPFGPLAAECGALAVPEDWSEPGGRTITLRVGRVRAPRADIGAPNFASVEHSRMAQRFLLMQAFRH